MVNVPSFTRDRALLIPELRFLGVELPQILIFTRERALRIHGLGSGFVTVLWESVRQLFQASTRVQTSYESRYSWRVCLDGISQYLDFSIIYC